jgi:5'-3' exonuclease
MNKLNLIFDEPIIQNKTICIFDISHLCHRCIHVAVHEAPDDQQNGLFYWKYLIINSIFSSINTNNPDRVIFAIDSKPVWRKQLYEQYKEHRRDPKSKINYDIFIPTMNDYIDELNQVFKNMLWIKQDLCEADDIVAILSKEHSKRHDSVTIVSSDHDFNQLLIDKNIKRYDPIKRDYALCLNIKKDMEMKYLTGCSSDNIKPIKRGVGPKTAAKLLNDGLEILLENEEIKDKYLMNRKLIDFNEIPQDLQDNIKNNYFDKEKQITQLDGKEVVKFLIKNKIRKITDEYYKYENSIKRCR